MEIISYIAKTVLEEFKTRSILDLEVFFLLTTLFSVEKFISNVPVTVLTDSQVLFYLFSSKIHNSSVKIRRWCLKLVSDYPNVTLHFVKSGQKLADFFNTCSTSWRWSTKIQYKGCSNKGLFWRITESRIYSSWMGKLCKHPPLLSNSNGNSGFQKSSQCT